MNGGIINSVTRLHPVGYFYWIILRCTDPWIFKKKIPKRIFPLFFRRKLCMNFCSYPRMLPSLIMYSVARIFMCRRKILFEARNLQGNVCILHYIIVSVLKSRKSISYTHSWIFSVFSHQTSPQEKKNNILYLNYAQRWFKAFGLTVNRLLS
jgi:hypothetical protein